MEIIRKTKVIYDLKRYNNVKCNLKEYVDFPHGFLNLVSVFQEAK